MYMCATAHHTTHHTAHITAEHTHQQNTVTYCFLFFLLGFEAAGAGAGGLGRFSLDEDDDAAVMGFVFAFCRAIPPSFCSESSTQSVSRPDQNPRAVPSQSGPEGPERQRMRLGSRPGVSTMPKHVFSSLRAATAPNHQAKPGLASGWGK